MIGVDWGTTSFRAFRITEDGTIRDRQNPGRAGSSTCRTDASRTRSGRRSAPGSPGERNTSCSPG